MKLLVQPEANGYQVQYSEDALRVDLDGGAGRYRRDILGGAPFVDVTFRLNPEDFNYLMAFYREETKEGSEPFEIDLFITEAGLTTCVARIMPGTWKLGEQSGLTYVISCRLELDLPFDEEQSENDQDVIEAYNTAHGYTP